MLPFSLKTTKYDSQKSFQIFNLYTNFNMSCNMTIKYNSGQKYSFSHDR